jgi:hypothetical protein
MLGDDVPADKATMISSDKPNMGEGLLMKRHSPQIPGLEPGIKQRDQFIVQSSENQPSTKVYCKGVILG